MNAQELTKKYYEQEDRIIRLERSVNALAEECGKLRLLLSDLTIDVKMMEGKHARQAKERPERH